VTLFPDPYLRYLGSDAPLIQIAKSTSARSSKSKVVHASSRSSHRSKRIRVGRGDTLWSIAKRHGMSVSSLKRFNGLRSSHLKMGQTLSIPAR
jgi:membrane-bound lytic murein transglycosylase D